MTTLTAPPQTTRQLPRLDTSRVDPMLGDLDDDLQVLVNKRAELLREAMTARGEHTDAERGVARAIRQDDEAIEQAGRSGKTPPATRKREAQARDREAKTFDTALAATAAANGATADLLAALRTDAGDRAAASFQQRITAEVSTIRELAEQLGQSLATYGSLTAVGQALDRARIVDKTRVGSSIKSFTPKPLSVVASGRAVDPASVVAALAVFEPGEGAR